METTIQTYQYTNPLDCMAVMCVDKVTLGIDDSNYHIFINSVEDISYIIRRAKLTPENTRVICADKPENLRKLPKGFGISKTLDPVKPISLYTATCFEGQDIYDGYGRTFIVSNGNKNHTLLDVRTSIIQISGRVRQSKYDHRIIHLYSTSKYGDITLEEFEESTEANFKKAVEHADRLNRNNTTEDRATLNSDNVYVRKLADNTFEADRNRANYELVNFKIENNIYKSYTNVIDELERSGLKITDKGFGEAPTEKLDAIVKSRYTFKDCFNDYCKLRESCSVSLDYE